MRFAAALSAPGEVAPLKEAGCEEVYLGVSEEAWRRRYGGHDSISRRQGAANLQSQEALKEALDEANVCQIPAWLALNARCTAPQYEYLVDLCRCFADWGGTGVILRDIGLFFALKRIALPLRYTASLLTVTVNADGARFFAEQGFDRVVLPRFLRRNEIAEIVHEVPELEYEVMAMGDKCPMIDGFCNSFHGQSHERAPSEAVPDGTFSTFDPSCEAHHLCEGLCRESDPCAACDMGFFSAAGVDVFKFGGRGKPIEARLRELRFFSRARESGNPDEIRRVYREAFGHECHCYYA